MTIIIKEIHVKTTVERTPGKPQLSKEIMSSLKRDILKELKDSRQAVNKKTRKDR